MRIKLAIVFAAVISSMLTLIAHARTTYYVNGTCGSDAWTETRSVCVAPNGPERTVQAEIDASATGDTVIVADATYTGNGNRDLDFGGRDIHLRSQSLDPALCVIDPADTAGQPEATAQIAAKPRRFVFDGRLYSTPCVTFAFSRPVETFGASGAIVPADEPRFSPPLTLASAPEIETVRATPGLIRVLATGLDHDGTTPLLVVRHYSHLLLDVFTVAGEALLEAEITGVGRNRTRLGDGGDIMQGSIPDRAYPPEAGVVCHGLIVLLCRVLERDGSGQWTPTGVALVVSQDQGVTWEFVYEDRPVQEGHARLAFWAMQNWWPMERGPNPLEAYFVATDYRNNLGADGGRFYMFCASRPSVSEEWTLEPVIRLYEQIGTLREHFHTGAVVPIGSGGLRAVVAVGDGQDLNRIVSLTRSDRNYLGPGWQVDETYHGSEGTPGAQGNQFVGCAPGPEPGQIIAGCDLTTPNLMLLTVDDLSKPHPKTEFLYGLGWADGRATLNFLVRTPTPELGGPYVATYRPQQGNQVPRCSRGLYSPDGRNWTQAFSRDSTDLFTIGLHGEHIYFDRRSLPPEGLLRVPVPRVVTRRPLVIGPGGLQRAVNDPLVQRGSYGMIEPLEKSPQGLWLDGGVPIDPQPPCAGPVYRVRASKYDAGRGIGRFLPAGNATNIGDILGIDALQIRCWVRNIQAESASRPFLQTGSSGQPAQIGQLLTVHNTDTWIPVTEVGDIVVGPGETLQIGLWNGTIQPADADFYLALDAAVEGLGFPGYAMMPDESDPPVGTWSPDELASVTGFSCGLRWTITLAAEIPWDGWDTSVASVPQWPIATLWSDEDNYIELLADTAEGKLVARIVRDGALAGALESGQLCWIRGSSVLVSIAEPGDGTGVQITLSAAGQPVREAIPAAPLFRTASLLLQPAQIRFGDHTGASGNGLEVRVSPMVWWGGRIDEQTFLGEEQRRMLLTSLDFLDLPVLTNPDCDHSGALDIFDFLCFQNSFVLGEPYACDCDPDPVCDIFDFLCFQSAFVAGCP